MVVSRLIFDLPDTKRLITILHSDTLTPIFLQPLIRLFYKLVISLLLNMISDIIL